MHSYPFYIDDWRSSDAVAAMTAEERGIYRELIDQCWREGSLPVSDRALQNFARATDKEWKRSRKAVLACFYEEAGVLRHRKVDRKRPGALCDPLYSSGKRSPSVERRMARMRAAGRVSPLVRKIVFERDGHKCKHCRTAERLTIDHILPICRGGSSHLINLQCLCIRCNSRKGGRMEISNEC